MNRARRADLQLRGARNLLVEDLDEVLARSLGRVEGRVGVSKDLGWAFGRTWHDAYANARTDRQLPSRRQVRPVQAHANRLGESQHVALVGVREKDRELV